MGRSLDHFSQSFLFPKSKLKKCKRKGDASLKVGEKGNCTSRMLLLKAPTWEKVQATDHHPFNPSISKSELKPKVGW